MPDFLPRSRSRLFLSALFLLASAGWVFVSRVSPDEAVENQIRAPQKGFRAPDFTLTSESGDSLTLSEFRGQAVLVNLWASWCGPCRAEMPAMQRVYDEFKGQGFVVLAVNATNQDSIAAATDFAALHSLDFPILFDTNGQVSAEYRLQALPSSYFIGRDGRIQEVVIGGPMAEALLRTRVETLLEPGN